MFTSKDVVLTTEVPVAKSFCSLCNHALVECRLRGSPSMVCPLCDRSRILQEYQDHWRMIRRYQRDMQIMARGFSLLMLIVLGLAFLHTFFPATFTNWR